jgi:Fe-Mn family superoxide dismutase
MPAIAPLPFKPPRLIELSEQLMADHYHKEYGQCVQQLNQFEQHLAQIDWSNIDANEVVSLHRQRDSLTNTATLHEVFFDCLGGEDGLGSPAVAPTGALAQAMQSAFGNHQQWHEQFVALANASTAPGWVVMSWSENQQSLVMQTLGENESVPAGTTALMAIDLFEHAYEADHGSNRSAYIDAFTKNLHWDRPAKRFERALAGSSTQATTNDHDPLPPELLAQMIERGESPQIIDVCLADDMPKRYDTVPNSLYLQAEKIDDWIKDLPKDKPIVAYCMYGFQVSGNAVNELRSQGYDARMLAGGIATWRALGQPTEPIKK